MGWIYDKSFADLKAFFFSAKWAKLKDVKVVAFGYIDSGGNTWQAIRDLGFEVIGVPHTGEDEQKHPISFRYCFYKWYLDQHPEFDKVMTTGLRDVVIQSDPFVYDSGDALLFFLESRKIKDCGWNRMWLQEAYGKDALDSISENWISCAEIVIGKRQRMLEYLAPMEKDICGPNKRLGVVDQSLHNLLLWGGLLGEVRTFHPGEGPVFTMGYKYSDGDEKDIRLNVDDKVLNDDGSIVPVIHQYDRFYLNDKLRAIYTENDRRRKDNRFEERRKMYRRIDERERHE